jgi:PAS domain S-box-containing protein
MIENVSFTKRYISALMIIACLSVLAYYNLNHLISSQANDGKIINLSSKQGMLSQQIALFAIYYKTDNLKANITLMEEAHDTLISFPMTKELKKIYFDEPYHLDKSVKEYLFHARRFEENRDGRSLTYILQNAQTLLHTLDLATSLYVKTTEGNTILLKNVELFIFIFTLITLFFEALFIFRPANKKITEVTREIVRQKNYSNTIIDSNTNAIITLDNHLTIRTFNKMAEKIFGYSEREMMQQPFFDHLVSSDDLFPSSLLMNRRLTLQDILTLENKEEVRTIEGVNKYGEKLPLRISIAVSDTHHKSLIIISIQDISKEILKDKMLLQQSRFAALGEMIAIIAHQWRQPLAQLNFNCMYIRKKLKDPELIIETSKNEEIIQFMSETITNFENFYKHTENHIFKPEQSIMQALKLLDSAIKQNVITVKLDIRSQITIDGNSNSLAQVILSIIQNSIDVVKNIPVDVPTIDIYLSEQENVITITIEDNAGGIKEKIIENIFKPFHSNKTKPSTGIGLYMSKLIIENQFHGSIFAENTQYGAKFSILLPKKI